MSDQELSIVKPDRWHAVPVSGAVISAPTKHLLKKRLSTEQVGPVNAIFRGKLVPLSLKPTF